MEFNFMISSGMLLRKDVAPAFAGLVASSFYIVVIINSEPYWNAVGDLHLRAVPMRTSPGGRRCSSVLWQDLTTFDVRERWT